MSAQRRRSAAALKKLLLTQIAERRALMKALPLRHVVQQDGNGCGIACVAMLADTTYAAAKRVLKRRKRSGLSTCYPDIRFALHALGVATDGRRRRFTSWDEIPGRAVVAIEQEPRRKSRWHWVVFDRLGERAVVWDPNRSGSDGVREDFESMKGRHYMLVGAEILRGRCGPPGKAAPSPIGHRMSSFALSVLHKTQPWSDIR